MKARLFVPCRNLRRAAAYTLAEVMIAVLLLGLMLVSLFGGFTMATGITRTSREDLRATQIMSQKMEAIRLCKWNNLITQCPHTFSESYDPLNPLNTNGIIYYGTISLTTPTYLPAAYTNKMVLITVTLNWTNMQGRTSVAHTRTMQTQSALDGLQNYVWGIQGYGVP